jgi:hypothetical protein
MGNICAGKHEKEETTETHENLNRNFTMSEYVLKKYGIIDLIIGNMIYHSIRYLPMSYFWYVADHCSEGVFGLLYGDEGLCGEFRTDYEFYNKPEKYMMSEYRECD